MNQPVPERDDLEARLAELHEASYGWACSCCGWDETDAEDVLQTAYVKVISGRARYDGRSTFRTWLFGVIRFTAREQSRRTKMRRERAGRMTREAQAAAAAATVAPDEVERDERAKLMREALAELPGRQRQVLHLVFYQDLTVQEAADVMEVSIGSARVHYDRAKKRLRALLQRARSGGDL
jgi:RNA polymerase sigma-70 factor (ECF subfamily)